MIPFIFTLELNGFPIKQACKDLKEIQRQDVEGFMLWQEARKNEILHYHFQHNEFYRKFASSHSFNTWEDVPVLKKQDLQVPLQTILTKGLKNNQLFINKTSGSTGVPLYFAKDKYCHALTWAVILDRYKWNDLEFSEKQARFYGIPKSGLPYYKEKFKDFLTNRDRYPVFNLGDETLWKYYKKVKSGWYVTLYGYTSSLVLFAEFLIRNKLELNHPTLKACIVTSEVCSPEDMLVLQKAFHVPVINEYGAAELDIIAFTDKAGNWLLNEETVYIEVVDDQNKPVPDGQEGHILVTSLFNKAMPFIRYDLGDLGVLDNKRKGIYRILNDQKGRVNDVGILRDGRRVPGLTFYYVAKKLMQDNHDVKEFIIRQKTMDEFHFIYSSEMELSAHDKEGVIKLFDEYLIPGLTIVFERQLVIQREPSGKLKHFFCDIKQG